MYGKRTSIPFFHDNLVRRYNKCTRDFFPPYQKTEETFVGRAKKRKGLLFYVPINGGDFCPTYEKTEGTFVRRTKKRKGLLCDVPEKHKGLLSDVPKNRRHFCPT